MFNIVEEKMKWFPELPDSLKLKPDQISGPCHHFNVRLVKCPKCHGTGYYTVLNVGEYSEEQMTMRCNRCNTKASK